MNRSAWHSEIRNYREQQQGTRGRRFCTDCGRLRVTYYTKRNARRGDPHFCVSCALKLGVDTARDAFAN